MKIIRAIRVVLSRLNDSDVLFGKFGKLGGVAGGVAGGVVGGVIGGVAGGVAGGVTDGGGDVGLFDGAVFVTF